MTLVSRPGMRPGVEVVIGGALYIAAPLTFGSMRRMNDIDRAAPSYPHDLLAFVLIESLSRNYEGVNALWLNENLEGSEVDAAALAELQIMRLSGLIKADKVGEPGEAQAGTG